MPKFSRKTLYVESGQEAKNILGRLVNGKERARLVESAISRDNARMYLRIAPKHHAAKVVGYLKGRVPCPFSTTTWSGGTVPAAIKHLDSGPLRQYRVV